MGNTMRWRYGETNPVILPVDAGSTVEIGDLVYLEVDDARGAASLPDQGTLAANQELLHDKFVGVAMQASPSGSTEPVRVATSGVFELECNAAMFEVGDLFGAEEEGTGTELESQAVVAVAATNLAVGRCVKRAATATSKVLVDIVSTIVKGGPQAAA